MLKLYFMPGSCALVPHVALEWSGLNYQAEEVSHEYIKSAEYLTLNPLGQVPLLVDGDWSLTQIIAIIDYIHDLAPEKGIFGNAAIKDIRVRAKARQWLAYANTDLHRLFFTIFKVVELTDRSEAQNNLLAQATVNVIKMFAHVNTTLTQHNYLAGDSISIADVYIYLILRWAKFCKIDLSQYSNLLAFRQRIEADPGVKAVLKSQKLI